MGRFQISPISDWFSDFKKIVKIAHLCSFILHKVFVWDFFKFGVTLCNCRLHPQCEVTGSFPRRSAISLKYFF